MKSTTVPEKPKTRLKLQLPLEIQSKIIEDSLIGLFEDTIHVFVQGTFWSVAFDTRQAYLVSILVYSRVSIFHRNTVIGVVRKHACALRDVFQKWGDSTVAEQWALLEHEILDDYSCIFDMILLARTVFARDKKNPRILMMILQNPSASAISDEQRRMRSNYIRAVFIAREW